MGGVTEYVTRALSVVEAGKAILDDPALPQVTTLVMRIQRAQQAKAARAGRPPSTAKGVGLSSVVKPLELYAYSQERPWVIPALVVGLLALPFMLGRASK